MKKLLIVCVLLLWTVPTFSQNEKEQLLIDQMESATSDTSRIRLMKSLLKSLLSTNIELCKEYAEKGLIISIRTGSREGEAVSYSFIGIYHFTKNNYVEATDYYLKALRLAKEVGNKQLVSGIYSNLAALNMKQGNLSEARNNVKEAIRLKEELGTKIGLANAYQVLGSILVSEKEYDQAQIYYEKGLEIARRNNDQSSEATCLNGLGAVQFKKENFSEAVLAYAQALELVKRLPGDYRKTISGAYHNLAQAYRKLGNYDKAIALLNESLALAKEVGSNEDLKQAYAELSAYYKEKGDLSKALTAQEYYSVYKDSVLNEKSRKTISSLQEKYKAEERKKEISNLQRQNGQLKEKSTLQYSLFIVSAGAFLVMVLAIFFYMKHQKAKQQKKQAQLEQKALRAQMNPHFIFNGLNSIQRLYIEGKEDIANDYMADFSKLLRSILENSGKEVIRLKEELEVVQLYMELEMIRTDNSFDYFCELDETIDPLLVKIPPLIFQPYLENAIWHGVIAKKEKGIIRLSIKKSQHGKLMCQVTDNGIGFYSGQKIKNIVGRKSRGMQITAERLGGEENVLVEEPEAGGTIIKITLDYTV